MEGEELKQGEEEKEKEKTIGKWVTNEMKAVIS